MENLIVVLEALACGVDPVTGAELAGREACRRPEVAGALGQTAACLRRVGRKGLRSMPKNAGRPWTAEETTALRRGFEGRRSVEQLMAAHRRTRGAVVARLRMAGLLPWPEPR